MNMVKRTWAEISLNAIEHNYNVIRNKVADDTKVTVQLSFHRFMKNSEQIFLLFQILTRV